MKDTNFIKKTVIDKIYPKDFNIKRNRYYGLRVGDKVIRSFDKASGKDKSIYTVYQYGFTDNNRIYLKSKTGKIISEVAEYCDIIKKVKK